MWNKINSCLCISPISFVVCPKEEQFICSKRRLFCPVHRHSDSHHFSHAVHQLSYCYVFLLIHLYCYSKLFKMLHFRWSFFFSFFYFVVISSHLVGVPCSFLISLWVLCLTKNLNLISMWLSSSGLSCQNYHGNVSRVSFP